MICRGILLDFFNNAQYSMEMWAEGPFVHRINSSQTQVLQISYWISYIRTTHRQANYLASQSFIMQKHPYLGSPGRYCITNQQKL